MKFKFKPVAALCGLLFSGAAMAQTVQSWMSPEVGDAWKQGYQGQRVTITAVDDFRSNLGFWGNLGSGTQLLRHGQWTIREAGMIAPSAALRRHDFSSEQAVYLRRGLNVLNASYGMYAAAGYAANQIAWSPQEASVIGYAADGRAVIAKAAGNDAVAVGSANAAGNLDYLNVALRGTQSAIYVGALSSNGTTAAPASMASYSNTAGTDAVVQKQFVVVGVEGNKTGLYGTSFAAPVVSGYAAILGSKFRKATPTAISNRLLDTARQDTIADYNPQTHGRGEASITRALAPVAIR